MDKQNFTLDQIKLKKNKVFRDAVFNYIPVEYDVLLKLINSKEMQRLRRIKQLGGTHQVYQSAEHSRFAHSLGVYYITRRIINDSVIGEYLSDYDKLTVMIAGLLHDLGHGPFSHCFENIFHTNHEEFTVRITREDSEVHTILEECVKGLSNDVALIIEKKHPSQILVQMISSQLDADRMDYLLRDSYFTGTTYGQFDLSRIIRVMQVYDNKIVYKQSGVQAIENYILARYHMYWQVYFHPTTRSYEQLLISIFLRIKDLYHEGYDLGDIRYLEPFLKGNISTNDYLKLDEGVILYYFRIFSEGNDDILCDLTSRFLNRHLFIYQDLISETQRKDIENEVLKHGYNPRYYVLTDDQKQVPYLHYGNNNDIGEIQILVNDELRALPQTSEIVGAITNSKKNKDDHKVYYPNITINI